MGTWLEKRKRTNVEREEKDTFVNMLMKSLRLKDLDALKSLIRTVIPGAIERLENKGGRKQKKKG